MSEGSLHGLDSGCFLLKGLMLAYFAGLDKEVMPRHAWTTSRLNLNPFVRMMPMIPRSGNPRSQREAQRHPGRSEKTSVIR